MVQKYLMQSQIIDDIAVITLSPIDADQLAINRLLEKKIYSETLQSAYNRFQPNQLDLRCEFGTGNIHRLYRWISSIIPHLGKANQPTPDQRQSLAPAANVKKGPIPIHSRFSGD